MQATLMRPRAAPRNPFFAFTGVPLGPLPMNATVPEPEVPVSYLNEDENGSPDSGIRDLDEILAARCASL